MDSNVATVRPSQTGSNRVGFYDFGSDHKLVWISWVVQLSVRLLNDP